jgi:hypothetical protein
MKKIIISSFVAITVLVAMMIAPATVAAPPPGGGVALEGVWNSQLTLTNCHGTIIRQLKAREMFIRGGTLASVDNSSQPGNGPGFGTWQYVGGYNFAAPFEFYQFNPDGTFAAVVKISRTITLTNNLNSYTSVVAVSAYGPNGNLLFNACGTETATRQQ